MRKPLTQKGWRNFKIITGTIDGVQILIDFIPGFGEAANEIIDIFIGVGLGLIYWYKRVITISALVALLFAFLGEEATAAGAPLWVLDVWYTQQSAPPAEEEQGVAIAGSYMAQNNPALQGGPANQSVGGKNVRIPDNARQKPLNIKENGVSMRPPRA